MPMTIKNLERAKYNNLDIQNSKSNVFKYLIYEEENILKSVFLNLILLTL